jgi:tRNA threonylcarbamoyladenosine biosynthesis protein TsaB
MIVLAIETATPDGSVAVARDGAVVASAQGDGTKPHATRLPGDALTLLAAAGLTLADVELFAVCLGPGAFTGLRVGIAAAQGLAFATERPIVGVSALDALGVAALEGAPPGTVAGVWMDAARQEVFAVRYRADTGCLFGASAIGHPVSARSDDVATAWAGEPIGIWIGDGALRYREDIVGAAIIDPTPPLAPLVARLGSLAGAAGQGGAPHALRPIYVRASDAELARARRGAR